MIPRRLIAVLIVAALVLPIVICVVLALARLLAGMNDAAGAAVLDRVALACGILWVLNLIGLVLIQAISTLADNRDQSDSE